MIKTKVAILGAGASALFLAKFLKKDFLLIDHNSLPKKLLISGGGKCNFTNEFVTSDNYVGDRELVKKVLKHYSNKELLKFFSDIPCKKIKNHQYFAKNSNYIVKKLDQEKFIADILDVEKRGKDFIVYTSKGDITTKKVVVATGGLSYKKLGSSDIGYKIAKRFGHTITPLSPALTGLTLQKEQFWMKELSGISLKVKIEVGDKTFVDDLLFSHYGITGPAIYNASLYWKKGHIKIDFLPDFKAYNTNKILSNTLNIPKRFVLSFLKAYGFKDIPLKDAKEQIRLLRNYTFAPAGTFGYEKAEVTRGGVSTKELREFESRFVKNLFFIGEVVDVTGELGGYNLQWCFSSAKYLADRLL